MRHERQVVGQQAVHERPQVGAQVGRDPLLRRAARRPGSARPERRRRGRDGAARPSSPAARPARAAPSGSRARAPRSSCDTATWSRPAGGKTSPVQPIAACSRSTSNPHAKGFVAVDDVGDPVVDRRRGRHVGRRETAHEAHVLDRERDLHVGPRGVVDGEERPDRLLRAVAPGPSPSSTSDCRATSGAKVIARRSSTATGARAGRGSRPGPVPAPSVLEGGEGVRAELGRGSARARQVVEQREVGLAAAYGQPESRTSAPVSGA